MKRQQGVSLVEVMVAVFILAVSLLGLGALQAKALPLAQSAHHRSIAADLAADLASRIRANRTPYLAKDGSGNTPTDLSTPPDFSKCLMNKASEAACTNEKYRTSKEMEEWQTALVTQLPSGSYSLTKETASSSEFYRYTLKITWQDDRLAKEAASQMASYTTVIE